MSRWGADPVEIAGTITDVRPGEATTTKTCGCPRCDYDQSGEIQSWKDRCPLVGRCCECGLEIEWRDLLSPSRAMPSWSFEHAHARKVRAFFGTVVRAAVPWMLTRSLKMHHEVRGGRLAMLVACGALLLYLSVVAYAVPIAAADVYWSLTNTGHQSVDILAVLRYVAWPLDFSPYGRGRGTESIAFACAMLVWMAAISLLFPLVPETIRRYQVRPRHFLRAGAYGGTAILLLASIQQILLGLSEWNSSQYYFTGMYFGVLSGVPEAIVERVQQVTLAWMVVFWWCVFRFYMRLPHAFWMSLLLNMIGGMLSLLVCLYLTGSLR